MGNDSTERRIGKYRLLSELGSGGMGIVYEAMDTDLGRRVALKVLTVTPKPDADLTLEEERFLREAQLIAGLPKHPHIVGVHEAAVIDGHRVIAMELILGLEMDEWREKKSPSRRAEVALLRDIARAVHHAHENGVIHRDLKPANILVDDKGQPHLTDFGLAKGVEQNKRLSLTAEGMTVGTPQYMSPEQARGAKTIDGRTDVYTLGVLLYEILTGETPFKGETAVEILVKTVNNSPRPPSAVMRANRTGRIDRGLEGICLKAMAKNLADRYPTAGALAEDLDTWLEGKEVKVSLPKKRNNTPLIYGAVATVLLGTLLAIAWGFSEGGSTLEEDLQRAERLVEEEQFHEAIVTYDLILSRHAGNLRARAGKQKAQATREEWIEREFERGRLLLDRADTETALDVFNGIIAQDPGNAHARDALREVIALENERVAKASESERADLQGRIAQAEQVLSRALVLSRTRVELNRPAVDFVAGAPQKSIGVRILDSPAGLKSLAGKTCIVLDASNAEQASLKLDVDDWWATETAAVELHVEYLDDSGRLRPTFNSVGDVLTKGLYYRSVGEIALEGTSTWKTARLLLSNTDFRKRSSRPFDLHLEAIEGKVAVHRISVQRYPTASMPPPPGPLKAVPVEGGAPQPGLTAVSESGASRIDTAIHLKGPSARGTTRWAGFFLAPTTGLYLFEARCAGGMQLRLDGVPILSTPLPHPLAVDLGACTLEAGYHSLELEFTGEADPSELRLDWHVLRNQKFNFVGKNCLFHVPEGKPIDRVWKAILESETDLPELTNRKRSPGEFAPEELARLFRKAVPEPSSALGRAMARALAERGAFDLAYDEMERVGGDPTEIVRMEQAQAMRIRSLMKRRSAFRTLIDSRAPLLTPELRRELTREHSGLKSAGDPRGLRVISFQDGVYPAPSYGGTRDVTLIQAEPDRAAGKETECLVDGDEPARTGKDAYVLLKWDVSALPPGTEIVAARFVLHVTSGTGNPYPIHPVLRDWRETETTWNVSAQGRAWKKDGARGDEDRDPSILGDAKENLKGFGHFALNEEGVKTVQSWVNDPSKNYGIIIAHRRYSDGLDFLSRESAVPELRPRLTVIYRK